MLQCCNGSCCLLHVACCNAVCNGILHAVRYAHGVLWLEDALAISHQIVNERNIQEYLWSKISPAPGNRLQPNTTHRMQRATCNGQHHAIMWCHGVLCALHRSSNAYYAWHSVACCIICIACCIICIACTCCALHVKGKVACSILHRLHRVYCMLHVVRCIVYGFTASYDVSLQLVRSPTRASSSASPQTSGSPGTKAATSGPSRTTRSQSRRSPAASVASSSKTWSSARCFTASGRCCTPAARASCSYTRNARRLSRGCCANRNCGYRATRGGLSIRSTCVMEMFAKAI